MSSVEALPYWQLTSIFEGLEAPDYLRAKAQSKTKLADLKKLMDDQTIASGEKLELSTELVALFEEVLLKVNGLSDDLADLRSFLNGFNAVDSFNDAAKAEISDLLTSSSVFSSLSKRFSAWLARLSLAELMTASSLAAEHEFALYKSQLNAEHLLADDLEALISDLDKTSGGAFARLHNDLISQITINVKVGSQDAQDYGIAELKNLQADPNAQIRKLAYEKELELLDSHVVSFAAAMNSIKGQMNTLMLSRGWNSVLEQAVFQNNISLKSLEAMQAACRDSFPWFRRYFKAKAKALGKDTLAWYDLQAPISVAEPKHYAWQEAKVFICETFALYSQELADYAERAFEQNWLDVPPRKGKRNGAFCMSVPGPKESRIMLNYGYTLDDIFTLAHELGHGFHNEQLFKANRTSSQRSTPMALAETASIFCETIVVNEMLERASHEEKLAILEQDLLGSAQLVIDIYSRFLFEHTVLEKRQERELSVSELNAIMLDAQTQTYGDALNAAERHPLMWAHKGHYYSTGRSFYNYPYTFGYLFGLGLYAEYQKQADGFQERYNHLLSSTGMTDAKTLAAGFGIDIEDLAFWKRSLSVAEARVVEYERLISMFKA